jgi:hypothetical protein
MDIGALILMLAGNSPVVVLILQILGILVIAGQAVVVLTPSKADDEAWEKIKGIPVLGALVSALSNFAPIQRK